MLYYSWQLNSFVEHFKILGPVLLPATALVLLAGCDTKSPQTEQQGAPDRRTHIQVADEPVDRIDLQYEPVSLSPDETFSIELSDAQHNRPVARITHTGTPNSHQSLTATFDHLEPRSVTIRCRNEAVNTRKTMTELNGDEVESKSKTAPVAKSSGDPDSYHVVNTEDGTYISVDYDEEAKSAAPSFHFSDSNKPVRCTHVSFVLNGITDLAPTGVQFGGDVAAPSIRRQKVKK